MQTIQELRETIKGLLLADPRFDGVNLLTEFAGNPATIPRNQPTVTIGLEEMEAMPSGLGDYLGSKEQVGHRGMNAQVVLRFDGFFPRDQAIASWDALFEGLCECLLASPLGITRVWQEPVKANSAQPVTQACAKASLQLLLTLGRVEQTINDFQIQYEGGIT